MEQISTTGFMKDSMPEHMIFLNAFQPEKKTVLQLKMRKKGADKKNCYVLTIPSPKQTNRQELPRAASLKGLLSATCGNNKAVGRKGVGSDRAKMVTNSDSYEELFHHSISSKEI